MKKRYVSPGVIMLELRSEQQMLTGSNVTGTQVFHDEYADMDGTVYTNRQSVWDDGIW